MKLTAFLIIALTLHVSATGYSQNTKLSLNMQNSSVKEILRQIEEKTDYRFIYANEAINLDKKVNLRVDNKTVKDVLDELFDGEGIRYTITDKNLILINPLNKDGQEDVRLQNFQQQDLVIHGKVTDSQGQPLPGVTVVIKGSTQGTITDTDGNYSLTRIRGNSVLVFSFVGMRTHEEEVNGRTAISIRLEEETIGLEEVVAIGYGTQKRKELTSAVSSVRQEDFNKGPITNSPLQLIQGQVPGLGISQSNGGDPDGEIQMQMRGVSTVKGNVSPLIVIDGVPGGDLNTVAPEDIASIDVLRDGSASAIYGTRGSNGVVIVTTRKGKMGAPTVEYSSYVYYQKYNNKVDVLSADDWRQLKIDFENSDNEVLRNKVPSMVDYGGDTDWFEEISQNKISQVHNLSVSGANQKTSYYASINYREIQGLVIRSYNNILNYRISVIHAALDGKLVFDFNIGNTYRKSRPSNYGLFTSAMLSNPTFPVYNEDGTFHEEEGGGNLLARQYLTQVDKQRSENLAIARVTLNVTDALKASVLGSLQRYNDINGTYYGRSAYASTIGGYRDLNGEATRSSEQSVDRTVEATITYDKLLNDLHRLNLVGGYSYQDFVDEAFGASNRNFISDAFTYNNLNAGKALSDGVYKNNDVWSSKRSSKLIAFFARAIYSYKDKYMFTAGVRREGSSKFGKDNKWGFFPAVTAGWRISEENFMKNSATISDLKLRVGYGVTGNQGIEEYVSLEKLSSGGMMLYNGQWISGYSPSSNPNPNLRWEKKAETNIGVDLGLFNNRLTVNLDVYNRKTTDLLYEYTVPVPPNLYNTLWTNVGEISNKGIELAINVVPVRKKNMVWTSNFNISYNRNKLISLSNDFYKTKYQDLEDLGAPGLGNVFAYRLEEGQPIGNMYGFALAGFTDDGKWLFWDENNENKLLATEAQYSDKRVIGNGLPKYWVGFTNNLAFGHFDASFLLRGSFGFDILNVKRLFYENRKLIPSNILKSGLTSPVIDDPQFSDYYVEKGDYLKLTNLTIGYTIPLKIKYISSARIYFATTNLLTLTGYKGQDPELEINGLTPGFDRKENSGRDEKLDYPSAKTFSLGCSIKF